jgi:hypothetical protein
VTGRAVQVREETSRRRYVRRRHSPGDRTYPYAAARSSFSPRATIRSAPSGSGLCNVSASSATGSLSNDLLTTSVQRLPLGFVKRWTTRSRTSAQWGVSMPSLSMGEAARLCGLSKSTLSRAVKDGRVSATRRDDGSYEIDPSELTRVYTIRPETLANPQQTVPVKHHTTAPEPDDVALQLARLEGEIGGLKGLLETERRHSEELRRDRDRWAATAERLLLTGPATHTPSAPAATPDFWSFLRWRRAS